MLFRSPQREPGGGVDDRRRDAAVDRSGGEVGELLVFGLPFDEKFANLASGTVHGGVTATVIDTASGFALRSTFDDPAAARLTTTDLNVRYLRPARDDLRVTAEVVRAGGSIGVTRCEATTGHEGERKVVATGGTSYRLFREEP